LGCGVRDRNDPVMPLTRGLGRHGSSWPSFVRGHSASRAATHMGFCQGRKEASEAVRAAAAERG
jgi:hypothetical protein